jgi:hypothetical protein
VHACVFVHICAWVNAHTRDGPFYGPVLWLWFCHRLSLFSLIKIGPFIMAKCISDKYLPVPWQSRGYWKILSVFLILSVVAKTVRLDTFPVTQTILFYDLTQLSLQNMVLIVHMCYFIWFLLQLFNISTHNTQESWKNCTRYSMLNTTF